MLVIETKCGHTYTHEGITNVRENKSERKRELRWTNARNEPRSMALCFIKAWKLLEPR